MGPPNFMINYAQTSRPPRHGGPNASALPPAYLPGNFGLREDCNKNTRHKDKILAVPDGAEERSAFGIRLGDVMPYAEMG